MIKVLHFTLGIGRGGTERQVSEIVQNCNKFKQYIVTLSYIEDNYFNNESIFLINSKNLIIRLLKFNKIIEVIKPDIIIGWGTVPFIIAVITKGLKNIKVINASIRHGVFSKTKGGYVRMLVARISKYVLANSQAGLKVNKINKGIVLYNGVNERFNRKNYPESEGKKKSDTFIFVSIMNLLPYKDYFTIFKALKLLKNDGINFKYYIIGNGPMKKYYDNYLMINDLTQNVIFCGSVNNPEKYLAGADIFIHSSDGEGCSNAILEAMYMGLPIITTDTGGTLEILDNNAITFSYQDYQALYKAISTLINDEKLRKEMREKSYSIVKERFTIERMIKNYERIISAIQGNDLNEISDLTFITNYADYINISEGV